MKNKKTNIIDDDDDDEDNDFHDQQTIAMKLTYEFKIFNFLFYFVP